MKKLMNRAGLLAAAFALALAVAMALNSAGQTPAVAQIPAATQTPTATHTPEAIQTPAAGANASAIGSDTDGNGLIEITNADQLNAMRWDLDGDGSEDADVPDADKGKHARYFHACSGTIPCKGYELKSDVSLALYDGKPASEDVWTPIGPWKSVFDSNGFSVTGLEGQHGLFGVIGGDETINAKTVVKNVDVVGAKITVADDTRGPVGVLAKTNYATIIGSYVTGELTRNATVNGALGGLVGHNMETGKIYASVADVSIKVTALPLSPPGQGRLVFRVGGFAGVNYGTIHRSYAYGNVRDARIDWLPEGPAPSPENRNATNTGHFKASGFAINHPGRGGTIHSSFSYGNKIITNGPAEDATAVEGSTYPAGFASGFQGANSCALKVWQFTCPPPTLTPTPTPTQSSTPTPTPTPTPTSTPTPTLTSTPTPTG